MHSIWLIVRNGGWGAMLALLLGIIGLLLGPAAGLTLVFSRRGAFYLGVVSLVVAIFGAGVGLLGMSSGRHMTDAAVQSVPLQVTRERIRAEGYEESQGAAKVGFAASVVPLLFGLLAVVMGAGARPKASGAPPPQQAQQPAYGAMAFAPPPLKPPSQGGRWLVGGVVASFALVTSAGALAAASAAVPQGKYTFAGEDIDAWKLAEARETFDTDQVQGCDDLDDALEVLWHPTDRRQWPRTFERDPDQLVPDWRNVATMCAQRMWTDIQAGKIVTTTPPGPPRLGHPPKTWDATALLESPLLVDERIRNELLASIAKPGLGLKLSDQVPDADAADAGGGLGLGAGGLGLTGIGGLGGGFGRGPAADAGVKSPGVRQGATTVNGRLPPEVIQRIVRRSMARFRLCYETGLRKKPDLEGTVKTKFVIATDGTVSSATDAGSDLPDESVKSCVRRAFQGLMFPVPEGGIVVVTYPLVFNPG